MKNILFILNLILIIFFTVDCTSDRSTTYEKIKNEIDQVNVINTHEHQRWPHHFGDRKFGFYHLASVSYLSADIHSAGGPGFDMDLADSLTLDQLWGTYGEGLNNSRTTSYYGHFVRGFRKLYDFEDLYFTRENINSLNSKIESNYQNYEKWLETATNMAKIDLMFVDQYWAPYNCELDPRFFALVFHINPLVMEAGNRPENSDPKRGIYKQAEKDGYSIENFDDYLTYCNYLFEKNIENKAVCVKNSMAYSRSLDYEDVPYKKAEELFNRSSGSLTPVEKKKIQDYMFHWVIQQSINYDLPIQIHTGYLAGNGNVLDNGKPVKLNNLFLKYPEARFVLFHGGYPWTGEYAALGKMFPNVYLDLVWLPQISRQAAVRGLDEIFDTVPYNKLFWGGDCHFIEETVGSLEFGKDVIAEVLAKRIERGVLDYEVAEIIINRVFRENAIDVFELDEKLGEEFSLGRTEL